MILAGSILDPIYRLVSTVLAGFYGVTHSYAIAIALLTVVIMVVVLPLTLKSTKSMLEMQQLQPELKKIQQQYTDMQQRNEAMMALYKEHNVSPLGGCVPMLLPLPVFIVMWRIIRGMTRLCTDKLLQDPKFAGLKVGQFCPDHISTNARLFKDLGGQTKMLSFGLDLSQPALHTIRDNVLKGIPYVLLVLLVTASSYYQQRQVTLRNAANQTANPQQQMLLKVFPLITGAMSLIFPAALILYWLVQNIFRIGQNAYITRRFYGEGGLGHRAAQASLAAKALGDVKSAKTDKNEKPEGTGKAKTTRPTPPAKGAKAVNPAKPPPGTKPAAGKASPSSRPSPQRPRPTPPRPKPNQK